MIHEVGIQYTIFMRGGGHRQAFFNAIAPENLDAMNEQAILNWSQALIKDMHSSQMVLIDAINRKGRVNEIYKFGS
jgi:hypothetical protein